MRIRNKVVEQQIRILLKENLIIIHVSIKKDNTKLINLKNKSISE